MTHVKVVLREGYWGSPRSPNSNHSILPAPFLYEDFMIRKLGDFSLYQQIFKYGKEAYLRGEDLKQNPFKDNFFAENAWIDGWMSKQY